MLRGLSRRDAIRIGGIGAAAMVAGCAGQMAGVGGGSTRQEGEHHDVSANEDLMRDHGVLRRVMLVWEASLASADADAETVGRCIGQSAQLVRVFVEDYHEPSEEQFIFPIISRQSAELAALAQVLTLQHAAGRPVTAEIRRLADAGAAGDAAGRRALAIAAFARMYRPHAAREDTVAFGAVHALGDAEYDALGERMEHFEHSQIGRDGYERALAQVAGWERELGIHELSTFTPGTPLEALAPAERIM
jgi:hemerythrin-like domain-containing protein